MINENMVNGKKCVFIQPVRLRDWRHSWGLLYMFSVLAMGKGGGGGASFSGVIQIHTCS